MFLIISLHCTDKNCKTKILSMLFNKAFFYISQRFSLWNYAIKKFLLLIIGTQKMVLSILIPLSYISGVKVVSDKHTCERSNHFAANL